MLGGMNLPPVPDQDRRTVPRHIRDGEHSLLDESLGSEAPPTVATRTRWWAYLLLVVVAGCVLWYLLRVAG